VKAQNDALMRKDKDVRTMKEGVQEWSATMSDSLLSHITSLISCLGDEIVRKEINQLARLRPMQHEDSEGKITVEFPLEVNDRTNLTNFMRKTFTDVVLRLDLSTRLLRHRIVQLEGIKKQVQAGHATIVEAAARKRPRDGEKADSAVPAASTSAAAPDTAPDHSMAAAHDPAPAQSMATDNGPTTFGGPSFGAASGYYWWHATRQYLEAQRMVLSCVLTAARANAIIRLARSSGFGAQKARPRVVRKRAFV
jgi:hypothetical protein